MYTLTKKDLQKLVKAAGLAARINEVDHLAPYVPSDVVSRRKSSLKTQLKDLGKGKEEKEEPNVNIRIEIPEKDKKEKSYKLDLKKLFRKDVDDDDDPVVRIIQDCWPEGERVNLGKIVDYL